MRNSFVVARERERKGKQRKEWEKNIPKAKKRKDIWEKEALKNNGEHPLVNKVTNRLLKRMRKTARSAIEGGGMTE